MVLKMILVLFAGDVPTDVVDRNLETGGRKALTEFFVIRVDRFIHLRAVWNCEHDGKMSQLGQERRVGRGECLEQFGDNGGPRCTVAFVYIGFGVFFDQQSGQMAMEWTEDPPPVVYSDIAEEDDGDGDGESFDGPDGEYRSELVESFPCAVAHVANNYAWAIDDELEAWFRVIRLMSGRMCMGEMARDDDCPRIAEEDVDSFVRVHKLICRSIRTRRVRQ